MKTLVISDIHGNLTALEAVLEDAGEIDAVWCLGDVVGYGPDPAKCVERVMELPNLICLTGNHDAAAIGLLDLITFNPEARLSMEWTQGQLKPEHIEFLSGRPETIVVDQVTMAHGSPRSPVYEYLLDTYLATVNFAYFETPICFVGHTHLPVQFFLEDGQDQAQLLFPEVNLDMKVRQRSILNPGSLGQPRDRDPQAAYAIYDTEENTWKPKRVPYDIQTVQVKMLQAGLPEKHIVRLEYGW